MSHKIIAITGASGFLGRHTVFELQDRGYEIIKLSRRKDLCDDYRYTDYSLDSLITIFNNVDAVIHLAATRGTKPFISDYHQNETLTQDIFEAAKVAGVKNIVFASSISVYSDKTNLPWRENQEASPVSFYGVSKLANESIAKIYCKKHGMRIKSLRFAHIYGANEENNYMINVFMRKAFNKETIKVNDADAVREFIYVKDAAKAISDIIFEDIDGVFNVGTGDNLTNLNVAEAINKVFNNDGNLTISSEGNNIESSYMLSEKIYNEIGFRNKFNFKEALKDIYEDMKRVKNV